MPSLLVAVSAAVTEQAQPSQAAPAVPRSCCAFRTFAARCARPQQCTGHYQSSTGELHRLYGAGTLALALASVFTGR